MTPQHTMKKPAGFHIEPRQVGLAVFALGIILTALMIWMGVSGHPWPQWLLGLTTVL